ncbi:MAG TPA: prolipoprotein diacylglyceryl transferase [Eubacteriaceae bacterium]|nr:prolipoprotein diacylglyceryl transferase [Eubacteriaceae bacterium]
MPSPIAFQVFGLEVRWYGILIATAFLIGIFLAIKRGAKKNIVSDDILDIVLAAVPAGIVGARLYYVLFRWDYYAAHLDEIFMIWKGGLAIHGGLIAGILAGYFVCRHKNIRFLTILDVFAPAFPIGQSLGRWGNYFNQEAYGTETDLPWAITVMDPVKGLIQVHPTFLYESIWNLAVFGLLLWYERYRKKYEGELIALYGIYYSTGRFFIEGLRTDSLMFFDLRVAQLISFAIIVASTLLWKKIRSQKHGDLQKRK